MQLFILTTLVSFLVAAPSPGLWGPLNGLGLHGLHGLHDFNGFNGFQDDHDDHDDHDIVPGNIIDGDVNAPKNSCKSHFKNVVVLDGKFDDSCTNTAVQANTNIHSNSNDGW
jgi:hypothetical protein